MAFAEGQRGHDLGLDAPHELLRSVEGVAGTVELELELAPRPEYGLVRPLFRRDGRAAARTFGGPNRIAVRAGVPVEIDDVDDARRRSPSATGERARASRCAGRRRRTPSRPSRPPPTQVAERIDGHGRGLALVGGRARHLRGPAPRARALQLARPEGPHLPARPARSSPRRPPRCRRPSAASATGTTASPGSATRASRSRRSTSAPAPTRPRTSSRS